MKNTESLPSLINWRSTDHLLFIVQVLVILVVVVTSIVNLTIENGNLNLWTALLSSCLGYILPNPKIRIEKKDASDQGFILHTSTEQRELNGPL